MTTYFDNAQDELGRLQNDKKYLDWLRNSPKVNTFFVEDAARQWEAKLVDDCTVAAYFPHTYNVIGALPACYKLAINQAVLTYGIYTLPDGVDLNIETPDQFWTRLADLCENLHSIFHEVAMDPSTPWGDNPLTGVLALASQGDMDREKVEAHAKTKKAHHET